jgi:septal ring factor EnvC (AmiA/AmiB activator)
MMLAESEATSQQQALLLQSGITQLQQQLGALQSDLAASQAEAYSTSCALSDSRASADALRSEISQLNEHIAAASARAAGNLMLRVALSSCSRRDILHQIWKARLLSCATKSSSKKAPSAVLTLACWSCLLKCSSKSLLLMRQPLLPVLSTRRL